VGTNAAQWRSRVGQYLSPAPDLVLASLGSNDAQSASLRAEFAANVTALCERARAVRARCVLLEAPNRTATQVAMPAGVEILVPPAVELAPDGIHPTGRGYRQWADFIYSTI
jgi:lysophospholipase L1-like esterase